MLDGVRAVAILIVLVHEFLRFDSQQGLVAPALALIAKHGATGVTLFFVLSGFLITRNLFRVRALPRRYLTFFGRRALRILPVYYLVIVGVLWWLPEHVPLQTQLPMWLFALNWTEPFTPGGPGPLPHFWSLAVEEQFYLVWPLIVFHCDRRRLLWVCALVALAAIASRVALVHWNYPPLAIYTFSVTRMDALAFGSALAAWLEAPAAQEMLRLHRRQLWLVTAGLLMAQVVLTLLLRLIAPGYSVVLYHTFVGLIWSTLVLAAVAVDARTRRVWPRVLASRPMRLIGKHSYAMYALHVPIAMLVSAALLGRLNGNAPVGWPVALELLVLLSTIVFVASWLCYLLYEGYFLRLRDRWFPMAVSK